MQFYALGTSPIITVLRNIGNTRQVWLADDATGAGKLKELKDWWEILVREGKKFGYYVNESKSWLIIKNPDKLQEAQEMFARMGIKFTSEGKRHLGAVIGSPEFKEEYATDLVTCWCKEVEKLTEIAHTAEPQLAYAAYIHGELHRPGGSIDSTRSSHPEESEIRENDGC